MKIAVVGLGLIGGSLCKALKRRTSHIILGLDTDRHALEEAVAQEAVDRPVSTDALHEADVAFICLHPQAAIDFTLQHVGDFRPGSLVMDVCGVKKAIVEALTPPLAARGVTFLGTHPMAGREFSGFAYAVDDLFENASFLLTPTEQTPPPAVDLARRLGRELGFARTIVTTPEEHDRVIAYTSQLAHVVSNAYIKSPSLALECGFSAGSFLDMTRVAKLHEGMWTQLFLMNREPLLYELDTILVHLREYRDALAADDREGLEALLRAGRERKEESIRRSAALPGCAHPCEASATDRQGSSRQ